MTSAIGMMAESGEYTEIMKKIIFQGKELNEDERFHMKRELGDIFMVLVSRLPGTRVYARRSYGRKYTQARKTIPEWF